MKEEIMSAVGVPVGGLKTVGQIVATNTLTFQAGQNGMAIAVELLSTHTAGAPVVDDQSKYVGFINEFDVMRALDAGKDLSKLTAEKEEMKTTTVDIANVSSLRLKWRVTNIQLAQKMKQKAQFTKGICA